MAGLISKLFNKTSTPGEGLDDGPMDGSRFRGSHGAVAHRAQAGDAQPASRTPQLTSTEVSAGQIPLTPPDAMEFTGDSTANVPVTQRTRALQQQQPLPDVGTMLSSRYQLNTVLGRGASAVVYEATDVVLDQTVAIKVLLLDGLCRSQSAREIGATLRAEARAAMRLSHPGIVRVYNYEFDAPWEYIVMEFVVGESLATYRKRRPDKRLTPEETIRWGIECAKALAYAHAQGVVHHDIKPANILLTRAGRLKLCDFGLARMAGMAWKQGYHAGTPAFLSPERADGAEGDARSDLYSLAATLYMLGNGRSLFGSRPEAALYGHRALPVPPSPHLPQAFHAVLERALQKDPKARFATARVMSEAMQRASSAHIAVHIDEGFSEISWAEPAKSSRPPPPAPDQARAVAVPEPPKRPAVEPPKRPAPPPPPAPPVAAAQPVVAAPPAPLVASEPPPRMPESREVLRAAAAARPSARPRLPKDMIAIAACNVMSAYVPGVYPVEAFAIDRAPVTNEQYAAYVKATGARAPGHWRKGMVPSDKLQHPVVGITIDEARQYAAHRGCRLPTNLEWEAAARSPDGRAFPWGDDWDPSKCHGPERSRGDTAPVDRNPQGGSDAGCLDLVGNVWEWTELDSRADQPEDGTVWVLGGSYAHPCSKGGAIARTSVNESKAYLYLGFRCAWSEEVDV